MPNTRKWFAKGKENNKKSNSSGGQPQRGSCSRSRNIMFICMLDARGEKGGSISCGVEGKREEKIKKGKKKSQPSGSRGLAGRGSS